MNWMLPAMSVPIRNFMEKLHSGDKLELVFDNPSSAESISAMCRNEGNPIVDQQRNGSKFLFVIQKA